MKKIIVLSLILLFPFQTYAFFSGGGGGSGTDDQTIDTLSVSGNNLQISLEDDGEAAQTVDISTTTAITANTAKVSYTPAIPGEIGGTTPAAITGTTITADSFVSTPAATGVVSLSDSDSLDANKTVARLTSNATTVTAGAVVSDLNLQIKTGAQASGVWLDALIFDGSDSQAEFQINTTLQAGDIIKADLATDSVDYTKTEGSYKSLTPVTGDADDFAANFTGANLYGGTFIANGTGTAQLPVMVAGMNFTIITLGAIAVIVDTNAADGYLMDGVTGVEGANLTNLSTAGDIAVIQYYTADDWLITTNGWTAE